MLLEARVILCWGLRASREDEVEKTETVRATWFKKLCDCGNANRAGVCQWLGRWPMADSDEADEEGANERLGICLPEFRGGLDRTL